MKRLSKRQQEIALLVAERLTAKQIGERLEISPRTVDCHRQHINHKLSVSTAKQMIDEQMS